ncbi:MAG TPA: ligase-associated DNA damage response exonuclease [Nitrosospira sp.]|nr:ligase-associated DNA damage response exonuclease [Nitrosospira sp.]
MTDLVVSTKEGLLCVPGQFYIDPWQPVERAVITHAHSDHARPGHAHYLAALPGANILKIRLGDIRLDTLAYGERITHNGVTISFHPAGHVLGSAQVRLEYKGEVWVLSGDYKLQPDGTCDVFESVACDTFVTESTFGLPIYRWKAVDIIFEDINHWWRRNAAEGRASLLYCYSFGKAQRILKGIDSTIGPIVCHGATETLNRIYRASGVSLPDTVSVSDVNSKNGFRDALIIAPPSAARSPWTRRFGDYSDAFASGWMLLRGARRRRGVDRGFVLSDHADWPGLMEAITSTGARRVIVTHGHVDVMVRWLRERGLQASAFDTAYGKEEEDDSTANEAIAFKESHA